MGVLGLKTEMKQMLGMLDLDWRLEHNEKLKKKEVIPFFKMLSGYCEGAWYYENDFIPEIAKAVLGKNEVIEIDKFWGTNDKISNLKFYGAKQKNKIVAEHGKKLIKQGKYNEVITLLFKYC